MFHSTNRQQKSIKVVVSNFKRPNYLYLHLPTIREGSVSSRHFVFTGASSVAPMMTAPRAYS
jgi:hypothetical protein